MAVTDLDAFYQALKGSGGQRLRGVVVESSLDPVVLTVECEVERIDWSFEPFDNSVYQGWHYDGLSLMPKRVEQLGDLADDLIDELETSCPNQVNGLVEELLESNLYDMSREMTCARYRIERLLAASESQQLKEYAQKMRKQKGWLMSHDHRNRVARYLFIELPQQLQKKGLEQSHYTHDNRLDELEQQLHTFPYQLYDKFLCDPVDFLREVYYHHVPRRYLFPLLSGIILMILKGRAKIQRWGREGDTEPISQIEAIAHPEMHAQQGGVLFSEQAEQYWRELEKAGFVDKHHHLLPSTTRQQAMYIADIFAEELNLKAKWKPFEQLWNIKNLAQEKHKFLELGSTPKRAKEIEEIFGI